MDTTPTTIQASGNPAAMGDDALRRCTVICGDAGDTRAVDLDSHVRYSDDGGGWTVFVFEHELPGWVTAGDELVCSDCAGDVALTGRITDVEVVSGGGLAPDRVRLTVR